MLTRVITIDGPAASGKSSVSREVAQRHGWVWVSTGAFYRGLARVARLEQVSLSDEMALGILAREPFWEVVLDMDRTKVFYRNDDITNDIYLEETGQDASLISRLPLVRKALLDAQRTCGRDANVLIAEGRDCGTVVFPDATLKIYLTAHAADRAQRRALEQGADLQKVEREHHQRDQQDLTRKEAPLQIPEDARVIDTTGLALKDVVNMVNQIVIERLRL